ncbi:DUF6246 family protein [Edaphovirga cremea]
MRYRPGAIPKFEMIILAQSLITHNIIGKAPIRRLQNSKQTAM